jgi:putative FmdB family regulatory protein
MPNYDYQCKFCFFRFERFKKRSELKDDSPEEHCPQCGSECKRIISGGTGVIFKGSGFYVNDYKKKEKK